MTAGDVDRMAVAMAVGDPLADQVLEGQASLAAVPVPGIDETVVWRVLDESGPHPWQLYVGVWPDGTVRVLTADQGAWDELVSAVGADLGDEAQARAYLEAYLEV